MFEKITSTQGSEGSVPGSPAGQAAFGSLGRDKARAVARTIAQVNISLKAHGLAFSPYIHKKSGGLIMIPAQINQIAFTTPLITSLTTKHQRSEMFGAGLEKLRENGQQAIPGCGSR